MSELGIFIVCVFAAVIVSVVCFAVYSVKRMEVEGWRYADERPDPLDWRSETRPMPVCRPTTLVDADGEVVS